MSCQRTHRSRRLFGNWTNQFTSSVGVTPPMHCSLMNFLHCLSGVVNWSSSRQHLEVANSKQITGTAVQTGYLNSWSWCWYLRLISVGGLLLCHNVMKNMHQVLQAQDLLRSSSVGLIPRWVVPIVTHWIRAWHSMLKVKGWTNYTSPCKEQWWRPSGTQAPSSSLPYEYVGTHGLQWELTNSAVTKSWSWNKAKKLHSPETMVNFRTTMEESILTSSINHLVCCHDRQRQEQTVAYHLLCGEGDIVQSAFPTGSTCLQARESSRLLLPQKLKKKNFLKCSYPPTGGRKLLTVKDQKSHNIKITSSWSHQQGQGVQWWLLYSQKLQIEVCHRQK